MVKEVVHRDKHDVRSFYTEKDIDPIQMRNHIENLLESDQGF